MPKKVSQGRGFYVGVSYLLYVCCLLSPTVQVIEDIRQQDRRLLEEDVLRQKERDAARCIQGAWKGWKLRIRLSQLKVQGVFPSAG